jgi:uncharacterized membrane protein YphA (DoxX/SURF4 family)
MDSSTTKRATGYWIATTLSSLLFAVPGVALLVRVPHFTQDMAHLGYPSYFLDVLGTWKILGALLILVPGLPRLKEWAYAGMVFDATTAALSRAEMGDGAVKIIAPLIITALVLFSWKLRPAGRVLMAA